MGSLRTLHHSSLKNLTDLLVQELSKHPILYKASVLSFDKPYEHITVRLEGWYNDSTHTFKIGKNVTKDIIKDLIKKKNFEETVARVVAVSFRDTDSRDSVLEITVMLK